MRERHNPDEKIKDNDLWRDDISFVVVWDRDLALTCEPFGSLNPASGPVAGPSPSPAAHRRSVAFSAPLHPLQQAAILYMEIWSFCRPTFFMTSKSLARGHQWSLWILLYCDLLRDGFVSLVEVRHSPAPLSKLVRVPGPKAKPIVHKLIRPPRFCLFKWKS